jgi:CDP-glycerol glycerophosphotransferase
VEGRHSGAVIAAPPVPHTSPSGAPRRDQARRSLERAIWAINQLVPKDDDQVVLYGMPAAEDGVQAVAAELVRRGKDPIVLYDGRRRPSWSHGRRAYSKTSVRGLLAYVRARFVFTSHALFGGLSAPASQTLVLLWHGEPPVKPVGLFDGDRPIGASCAPVCSTLGRAYRAAEFGLSPARIPIVGAPRNDRMLRLDRAAVRSALGWAQDRKTWIWLPTYRSAIRGAVREDSVSGALGLPFDELQLRELDALLAAADIDVVLKPHPLAAQAMPRFERLHVLTQQELDESDISLYQILGASDGLITDLSSVWIDYLLLDRPIVFAFPDIEAYRRRRGINMEPYEEWVPGPLVCGVADLARQLGAAGAEDHFAEDRRRAVRRLHAHHDADSAARLLDVLSIA